MLLPALCSTAFLRLLQYLYNCEANLLPKYMLTILVVHIVSAKGKIVITSDNCKDAPVKVKNGNKIYGANFSKILPNCSLH